MKKKQKRQIANVVMILTVLVILITGVIFAGSLRGWF